MTVGDRDRSLYTPPAPLRTDWHATERQAQVIALIGEGLTVAQVASRLGIAESTVNDHMETISFALSNPDGLTKRDLIFLYANHCRWLAWLAANADQRQAS